MCKYAYAISLIPFIYFTYINGHKKVAFGISALIATLLVYLFGTFDATLCPYINTEMTLIVAAAVGSIVLFSMILSKTGRAIEPVKVT